MARPCSFAGTPLLAAVVLFAAACGSASTDSESAPVLRATVPAPDGVPIVYEVRGSGDTALVFVHCWSCNREFWREQVDAFDDGYRVVTLDLGGHGESGAGREEWSIAGLATDVVAVADDLALDRIVLIGHSMGGPVALEAAQLMPGRVLGVVAVDTLQDADFEFSEEQVESMVADFQADFEGTMRGMFSGMAAEQMDAELRRWIVEEAVAARPDVAIALMRDFCELDLPSMFESAGAPIRAINAEASERSVATNFEGNREYADFDAVIMDGVGHFLQLERPEEFNDHLRSFVEQLAAS